MDFTTVINFDICQRRWRRFQDQFVKHKRKQILSSDSAGGTQKDWKYAKMMSFLNPHVQPRSSRSNIRPALSQEREATESIGEAPPSPSPAATSGTPPSPLAPSAAVRQGRSRSPRERSNLHQTAGSKRTTSRSFEERLVSLLEEQSDETVVPKGRNDEVYHFALSLVPALAGLSEEQLYNAKMGILRDIRRARVDGATGHLNNHHTPPQTPQSFQTPPQHVYCNQPSSPRPTGAYAAMLTDELDPQARDFFDL
ncbi:hypothetical protein FQA47_022266 [Oryzias melastigma]|uniref:MADF domain-containing protein n=1 Tax=Oryzias melastigma TaxID=30732 RepID=A0A834FIP6_ORYME|nr:hypothetical protein FQA47_022266 [Oryzias melastigma]